MPHIASKLLREAGIPITVDKAAADIDKYISDNATFRFTMENADGKVLEETHYSLYFTMGSISLLLFFALSLFALPYTEKQFLPIAKRVGLAKAIRSYAFGSIVFVAVLFFAATASSLLISQTLFKTDVAEFILPSGVYIVFLAALALIATAVFGSTEKVRVPIMALCIASLAVCPVFVDIAEFISIPMWIRHIVPAYFFYTAIDHTALCAAFALVLFVFGCTLYTLVLKKKLHR